MRIIDKLFGTSKVVNDLKSQIKQLQKRSIAIQLNASTSIFPTYQELENINTYTTVDDVYSIVTLLAETAARIPMYGYKIISESSMKNYKRFNQTSIHGKYYRRKAMQDLPDEDPFVTFLNSIDYAEKIKYYTILYIAGELFLYKQIIEFGPNKGKVQLHILNNQNISVILSDSFPQQVLGYRYYDVDFEGEFAANEVMHIKYFNPDYSNGRNFRGLSPLQVLSKRLTRLEAGMNATVAQVQNGGVPGIVYEKNDYAIETLGQRKNDFSSYLRNSGNKGAPYFAAGEMGYIELGLSLADMSVLDLQNIDFTKLCNAYKIPEVLLNNHKASTDNNVNWAEKRLYTNSILPNIYLLRDAFVNQIAPLFGGGVKRTIEIDLSEIPSLHEDIKQQASALDAMWWITPNEKRDIMQFEEIDDPLMNQILIDTNKMLLGDLKIIDPITPPTE